MQWIFVIDTTRSFYIIELDKISLYIQLFSTKNNNLGF